MQLEPTTLPPIQSVTHELAHRTSAQLQCHANDDEDPDNSDWRPWWMLAPLCIAAAASDNGTYAVCLAVDVDDRTTYVSTAHCEDEFIHNKKGSRRAFFNRCKWRISNNGWNTGMNMSCDLCLARHINHFAPAVIGTVSDVIRTWCGKPAYVFAQNWTTSTASFHLWLSSWQSCSNLFLLLKRAHAFSFSIAHRLLHYASIKVHFLDKKIKIEEKLWRLHYCVASVIYWSEILQMASEVSTLCQYALVQTPNLILRSVWKCDFRRFSTNTLLFFCYRLRYIIFFVIKCYSECS